MTNQTEHWDSIFASKAQDVSWWQDGEQLWLDLVQPLIADHDAHIADIGSGTSLLLETLAQRGFLNLSAIDISHEALDRLQQRAHDAGVHIKSYISDIADLQVSELFDVWHDRAVFHFMNTLDAQQAYKASLIRNLSDDGHVVIATFSKDGPLQCSGLDVAQWNANELTDFFAPEFSIVSSGNRDHSTPWGSVQNFTWVQLKRNAP